MGRPKIMGLPMPNSGHLLQRGEDEGRRPSAGARARLTAPARLEPSSGSLLGSPTAARMLRAAMLPSPRAPRVALLRPASVTSSSQLSHVTPCFRRLTRPSCADLSSHGHDLLATSTWLSSLPWSSKHSDFFSPMVVVIFKAVVVMNITVAFSSVASTQYCVVHNGLPQNKIYNEKNNNNKNT